MTLSPTVVVCTHNRAEDAVACLTALDAQTGGSAEVILLDSASNEEHARALVEFAASREGVQYRRSDLAGLSVARNAAARAATGEWLAYLDDDARPLDGWWAAARRATAEAAPDVVVIGGRILPGFPAERPQHIGPRWLMFLSCIEAPSQDPTDPLPTCFGANLLVRRDELLAVGGFPLQLGRVGDVLLSGEEVRLQQLLLERGGRIVYEGSMAVRHLIGQERTTRSWIRKRAYWGGVSEIVATRLVGARGRHLNPVKAVSAFLLLGLLSRVSDPVSDRYIRAHYARGVVAATWGPLRSYTPAPAPLTRPESRSSDV